MRSIKLAVLLLLAVLLTGCGQKTEEERIEGRCREIVGMYEGAYRNAEIVGSEDQWNEPKLTQGSIDGIEQLLADGGLDVVDTNGEYPSYLTTGARFLDFWTQVGQGKDAQQEVITILDSGELSYCLFSYADGEAYLYLMTCSPEEETPVSYEKHEVFDWELTEQGNFYYRIYPAEDRHYDDYSMLRLNAPDPALWDMTARYIAPVGYVAVNLFLCDWSEDDPGELSFNDLFEALYYAQRGERFSTVGCTYLPDRFCYEIPAAEFEEILLPYFAVDLESFRELAQYDAQTDSYPWRPLETNDYTQLWFYGAEPEVTACRDNPDGTVTLTVEARSGDLKLDCLFAHEVTIRLLENGQFQYVGNQVTYQTEYGLPYCEPRLTWDESI